MEETNIDNVKTCSVCNNNKNINDFSSKNICKSCCNEKKRLIYKNNEEYRNKKNANRRLKYQQDDDQRNKLIKKASEYKHNKVIIRQQLKAEEDEKIGLDNKKCSYCLEIKLKEKYIIL